MKTTYTFTRGKYKRNMPFYEVKHHGKTIRFSGKTKAINYAKSIANNIFNPNTSRIDIVNTETGEVTKFQ